MARRGYPPEFRRRVLDLLEAGRKVAVDMRVEVPPRPELHPFELTMALDGRAATRLALASPAEAGGHVLRAELPDGTRAREAVEVDLTTRADWATTEDSTMRSDYPLSARVVD